MEGFSEPHPSQLWLVNAFFRLHRRREYSEIGPKPIPYSDMLTLSDHILKLTPLCREVYFETIEETDSTVLEFLFNRNAAKLAQDNPTKKGENK